MISDYSREDDERAKEVFGQSVKAWVQINELLGVGGPDALLGHSYLMDLATDLKQESRKPKAALDVWVQHHWNHHILPQLADVLVTHSLESRLIRPVSQEGKAVTPGKLEGNILAVKVGDWPIIQPPGVASSERGLHGTLVLMLKPMPPQNGSAAVGSTQPTGAYVPQLLKGQGPDGDLCGVYFPTVGGPGKLGSKRGAIIDSFWKQLEQPNAPKPHSIRYAKGGVFGSDVSDVIADVPVGILDVEDIKQKIALRAKNYKVSGATHSYPWACYFKSESLEWVEALVKELGKPATSK